MANKKLKFQEFLFWHQQAAEKEKLWLEMNPGLDGGAAAAPGGATPSWQRGGSGL